MKSILKIKDLFNIFKDTYIYALEEYLFFLYCFFLVASSLMSAC